MTMKFKVIVTRRDILNRIVRQEFTLSGDVSLLPEQTVNQLALKIERSLNSVAMEDGIAIRVHSSIENEESNG